MALHSTTLAWHSCPSFHFWDACSWRLWQYPSLIFLWWKLYWEMFWVKHPEGVFPKRETELGLRSAMFLCTAWHKSSSSSLVCVSHRTLHYSTGPWCPTVITLEWFLWPGIIVYSWSMRTGENMNISEKIFSGALLQHWQRDFYLFTSWWMRYCSPICSTELQKYKRAASAIQWQAARSFWWYGVGSWRERKVGACQNRLH